MKKRISVVLVLAIIVTMVFTACDPGSEPQGKLTIVNFAVDSAGNPGLTANNYTSGQTRTEGIFIENKYLIFSASLTSDGIALGEKIPSNGSITLNVYEVFFDPGSVSLYSGNEVLPENSLGIGEYIVDEVGKYTLFRQFANIVPIAFSNGSATINFSTQMELYED